ncbi:MAG: hypothetical protein RMJ19_10470, partial [Gemmatales bacterium]|nr:hypothetical protein [Gemmatales bacterium]MDW8176085.1 hypothetical protein [Gemmatales bacterium]
GLKQQQPVQQSRAFRQPQPRYIHGNGTLRSLAHQRASQAPGKPTIPRICPSNTKIALMHRKRMLRPRHIGFFTSLHPQLECQTPQAARLISPDAAKPIGSQQRWFSAQESFWLPQSVICPTD